MADISRYRVVLRVPSPALKSVFGRTRIYPAHAGSEWLTSLPVLGRQPGGSHRYRVEIHLPGEGLRAIWGGSYLNPDNPHALWLNSRPALVLSPLSTNTQPRLDDDNDFLRNVVIGSNFDLEIPRRSSESLGTVRTPYISQSPGQKNDPVWNPGLRLEQLSPGQSTFAQTPSPSQVTHAGMSGLPGFTQGTRRPAPSSPSSPPPATRRRLEYRLDPAHPRYYQPPTSQVRLPPNTTAALARSIVTANQRTAIQEDLDYCRQQWKIRVDTHFLPLLNSLGPTEFRLAAGTQYALEEEQYLETIANMERVLEFEVNTIAPTATTADAMDSMSDRIAQGCAGQHEFIGQHHTSHYQGTYYQYHGNQALTRRNPNRNLWNTPTSIPILQTPTQRQETIARWQASVGMGCNWVHDSSDSGCSDGRSSTPSVDSEGNPILPSIEFDEPVARRRYVECESDTVGDSGNDSENDLKGGSGGGSEDGSEANSNHNSNDGSKGGSEGDFEDTFENAERAREEERWLAADYEEVADSEMKDWYDEDEGEWYEVDGNEAAEGDEDEE